MIEAAKAFATRAHAAAGQRRKYTGAPYIEHPAAVAALVAAAGGDAAMIAAAWLHDVVEDTGVPLAAIEVDFGPEVAELVSWLTKPEASGAGDREARKAQECAHLAAAPVRAKAVKLADLIDNTATVVERDPIFAATYLREKLAVLDVLADAAGGSAVAAALLPRARAIVEQGLATLSAAR
ncbi:HD domain-containing protein [Zavarzinia compransoris]|nr:HD domain-containing protein [Zavarzinia compransoris]TDP48204.1 HD domain-containing protein [Zavarzinia compransoris]